MKVYNDKADRNFKQIDHNMYQNSILPFSFLGISFKVGNFTDQLGLRVLKLIQLPIV